MLQLYWPIAVIVLSNVVYHAASKSVPASVSPFASLTVTYAAGAALSAVLFFLSRPDGGLLAQYRQLNWSSIVMGLAVVGLEGGTICMYKAGWDISAGQLVHSMLLAVCLIAIGYFAYHEQIGWTRIAGVLVCMAGLYLVNR